MRAYRDVLFVSKLLMFWLRTVSRVRDSSDTPQLAIGSEEYKRIARPVGARPYKN